MPPKNDGSESCDATLTIGNVSYDGKTGSLTGGHAEMNALRNFIVDYNSTQEAYDALEAEDNRIVSCPAKSCCLKCSYVLKKLGFTCEEGTSYSSKSMGSTEWGTSLKVRELLKIAGIDYDKVCALA